MRPHLPQSRGSKSPPRRTAAPVPYRCPPHGTPSLGDKTQPLGQRRPPDGNGQRRNRRQRAEQPRRGVLPLRRQQLQQFTVNVHASTPSKLSDVVHTPLLPAVLVGGDVIDPLQPPLGPVDLRPPAAPKGQIPQHRHPCGQAAPPQRGLGLCLRIAALSHHPLEPPAGGDVPGILGGGENAPVPARHHGPVHHISHGRPPGNLQHPLRRQGTAPPPPFVTVSAPSRTAISRPSPTALRRMENADSPGPVTMVR